MDQDRSEHALRHGYGSKTISFEENCVCRKCQFCFERKRIPIPRLFHVKSRNSKISQKNDRHHSDSVLRLYRLRPLVEPLHTHSKPLSVVISLPSKTELFFLRHFTQRIWLTFLAINYFVYIGMTKNLLRFFSCADVSDDEMEETGTSLVWEEDSNVDCYSKRHAVIVGVLVIPLICVITIGFPLGTFLVLWGNKERLNEEEFVATYGFLYRAYDRHYWEVVIMLRKAAIAIVVVFDYHLGENLQGLLCVLIMMVALCFHLKLEPFTKEMPRLNFYESCSLFTTILIFVIGLMMNEDQTSNRGRNVLGVLAIFAVVFTVLVIVSGLVGATEEVLDMMLIEKEIMEIADIVDTQLSRKVEILAAHYYQLFTAIVGRVLHFAKEKLPTKQNATNQPPPENENPNESKPSFMV